MVAKSLRDIYKKHDHNHSNEEEKSHHCCGMMSMAEKGMGYEDLDNLVANPQPLTFTLGNYGFSHHVRCNIHTW